MEEKEVRTAPQEDEQPVSPALTEQPEETDETAQTESAPEPEERLYFGRFTAGVWHGGILGLALGYILIGVLGLLDSKFSFGIRHILENSFFKYGLMLVLMYVLGKFGGHLEKQRQAQQDE